MKNRKILSLLSLLLIMGMLFGAVPGHAAAAVDETKVSAANACMLVDVASESVIYASENASLQIYPASTTKVLTATIVLDKCNLDDMVTCGPEVNTNGSKLGLVEGEEISVRDLLYGMMLVSGNDCSVALAKHISGSVEAFAELMNQKAQEIGMTNSHFVNPNGLHNEEHYVTCEDMAKLMLYAIKNYPELNEFAAETSHIFPANNKRADSYEKFTTNKLLYKLDNDAVDYTYQYATGYKTGSTSFAGGCLLATAEKNDTRLIALVFGVTEEAPGHNRWEVAKYLFDYGFENFVTKNIYNLAAGQVVTATVNNAILEDGSKGIKEISCMLDIPEDAIATVDRADAETQELRIEFDPTNGVLEAPVYQGDTIGRAKLYYGEKAVYECDAVAAENALSTIEEVEKIEGPVSEIEQVDLDQNSAESLTKEDLSSLWWLILIPAVAVVIILVLAILKNRKKSGLGYLKKREKLSRTAEKPVQYQTIRRQTVSRRESYSDRGRKRRRYRR